MMQAGFGIYRAPSWLKSKAGSGNLKWRVVALNQGGAPVGETPWRKLQLAN